MGYRIKIPGLLGCFQIQSDENYDEERAVNLVDKTRPPSFPKAVCGAIVSTYAAPIAGFLNLRRPNFLDPGITGSTQANHLE